MTSLPPLPPGPSGAGQAVFVSDAPRRARVVRWTARVAALLAVAYVVMTAGGMVGASWVPHVSLPGVGPVTLEQHPDSAPSLGTTAQTLVTPDLSRASSGSGRTSTTTTVISRGNANVGVTTTVVRGRSGSNSPNTPSTNPGGNTPGGGKTSTTRSTKDTTSPGRSGSAPGHTSTTSHGH